jgi:DNA-binding NtrC family response regulator
MDTTDSRPVDVVLPDEWPTLAEIECEHIRRTLEFADYDERAAAELLQMDWHQFQHRLDQYDLRSQPAIHTLPLQRKAA